MLQRRVGKLRNEFQQTVLINDTVFDSQYFRVDDFPQELTSGKNFFKIYGDNELLVPSSDILIQVTDINGSPVYHHVNNFVDAGGRIFIGIWIYPETPPGLGRVEIIGTAMRRPDGRSVPFNWTNRINVKWSREVIISPQKINKSPITFQKIPGVKITEYEREYLTQTYLAGSSIASQSVGQVNYNYNGYGEATIIIQGANFSSSMAGGLIIIPEPDTSLPSGYNLQPGVMDNETGQLPEYRSYISQVINSTTIKADPYVLPVTSTQNVSYANTAGGRGGGTSPATSTVNSALPITSFGNSDYTIEWQQDAIYATGSTNSQSFASITLKNLDPIVGKVHSIRTYMRSHGYAEYQNMGEEILQERDLLINVDSALAYDRLGDFKSQELINEYWDSGSVNQSINFANKHSDTEMISSLIITGSDLLNGTTGYPNAPQVDDPYIFVKSKNSVEVYKDNEYQIKFKVVAEAYEGQVSSSYLAVYVSGSDVSNDEFGLGEKLTVLESTNVAPRFVTNTQNFINNTYTSNNYAPSRNTYTAPSVELVANFSPNSSTAVNPITVPDIDERLLELNFTPQKDTDIFLTFVVYRGKWHISDVSIEGANDYGFTPNHTFIEIPIQTPQADDVLDFKFEFYNAAGDIANVTLTTQSLDFVGSNLYISGNDNFMSGSINIGNGIMMQGFTAQRN